MVSVPVEANSARTTISLVDTHAHLTDEQLEGILEEVIERALESRVRLIVNAGVDLPSSRAGIAVAKRYPQVVTTVGIHPHYANTFQTNDLDELAELARHPKVVAIGEIGLDYYRNYSPKEAQLEAFHSQLELATMVGLPVVIHSRQAEEDMLAALRNWPGPGTWPKGVMHCFSGKLPMALQLVELGFHISIAGPVTYSNAAHLLEVVRGVPLDSLVVETDSPYLAPVPKRGGKNEPAFVKFVAEKVAALRGLSLEELAQATTINASRLFRRQRLDQK